MHSRLWPGLLLVVLIPASTLLAQPPRREKAAGGAILLPDSGTSERPSHRRTDTRFLENIARPNDAVDSRLGPSRSRKETLDLLDDKDAQQAIQKLAKRLMKDEKFMESLKDKFTPEDVTRLLGKVGAGKGIGDDPELQHLLRQAMGSGNFTDADKDRMRSWSDMLRAKGVPDPPEERASNPAEAAGGPGAVGATPTPPNMPPIRPPVPTPPKPDDGPQDWMKKFLEKSANNLDGWKDSPTAKSWANLFKGMGDRLTKNPIATPEFAERAGRLTRFMPRFNKMLPKVRPPRIPEAYLPRLPSFSGVSRTGMPSSSLVTPGKALVWVAVIGVIAFLLWRAGGALERVRQARASTWRLGPWPVRPENVKTRGDLVRAFEHLALLCLGRDARTHHHLDLAEQMGRQPSLDQDRRKEAAEDLARLYEQARYTPDDERLADEDVRRARRDLSFLAGETAA